MKKEQWLKLEKEGQRIDGSDIRDIYLIKPGSSIGNEDPLILKVKVKYVTCLEHEYRVGRAINSYGQRNKFVIQTIDRAMIEDKGYLLLSFAEGQTLHQVIKNKKDKVSRKDRIIMFYMLFLEIEQLNRQTGFTHYDLHCSNVLAHKLDNKKKYVYQPQGFQTPIQIESNYQLTLIDYGYSHHPEVNDTWVEVRAASVRSGAVVSVSDNIFDLACVLGKTCFYLNISNEKVNSMLIDNKFIPFTGGDSQRTVLGRVGREFIYELYSVPDHPLFYRTFYNTSDPRLGCPCQLLSDDNKSQIVSREAIIHDDDTKTSKEIAACLTQIKQDQIAKRKNSRDEVVKVGCDFFNEILKKH